MVEDEDRYKTCLMAFMSFKNNKSYNADYEFTQAEFLEITPNDICRYFKYRTYGDADANEDKENPIQARSNSVKFWKKSISYFMPNNLMAYNEVGKTGNPTRHAMINKLTGKIKRKDAARLGKESQARRALFVSEFENAIELMKKIAIRKFHASSLLTFDFNIV